MWISAFGNESTASGIAHSQLPQWPSTKIALWRRSNSCVPDLEVPAHAVADLVRVHRHELEPLERDVALMAVAALLDAIELGRGGFRERTAQVVARHRAPQAQDPVHEPERHVGDAVEHPQREPREGAQQRNRREVHEHLEGVAPPAPLPSCLAPATALRHRPRSAVPLAPRVVTPARDGHRAGPRAC